MALQVKMLVRGCGDGQIKLNIWNKWVPRCSKINADKTEVPECQGKNYFRLRVRLVALSLVVLRLEPMGPKGSLRVLVVDTCRDAPGAQTPVIGN